MMSRCTLRLLQAWSPKQAFETVRLGSTVVVAVYLAMTFELSRPEWAAWTVLSVALPTRASSLQKSSWRVMGSLVGAAASVLIVAFCAQDTLAFDIMLVLWLGLATFLASTARGQDSYGFALIGFSVLIIALSNVSQPMAIFDTAVDRCSTLLVGIACAHVSSLLVASGTATVRIGLAYRIEGSVAACQDWLHDGWELGIWGRPPVKAVLALDGAVLDAFAEQPSLRAGGRMVAETVPALLGVLAAGLLQARLPWENLRSADALLAWSVPGANWRLRRAAATARMLRIGRRLGVRRFSSRRLSFDRDWRHAGNNALRTVVAVSLVNGFWYVSDWSSGGAAVTWTGLVSMILASRDNQVREALAFLFGAILAELIGTVAHYTLLTSTGVFAQLAVVTLCIAMLAAAGRTDQRVAMASGFGIVIFIAVEPLNVMKFDLASSLNGALATLLGVGTAVLAFATLPPPVGAEIRCLRARRRLSRGVRAIARRPAFLLPQGRQWCAPMLERAELLAPEGDAAVAAGHTLALVGLLLLALRRQKDTLGLEAGQIVIGSKPERAARLIALAEQSGPTLQRRRLLAIAALLEHDLSMGFGALIPTGAA